MKKPLDELKDPQVFKREFTQFAMKTLDPARFSPKISDARLFEAHGAWLNDLRRVGEHEKNLKRGLDHFKQCGHLSYWLRRFSPIIEFVDLDFGESERPMTAGEIALRTLMEGYSNEYMAFDFCFQICRHYEAESLERTSPRAKTIILSNDYYKLVCHFMKYKHVSPHAMHLVYKSLFFFNDMDTDDTQLITA